MKTLKEEAREYIDIYCDGDPYLSRADLEDMLESFASKSKWVQAEKIKAQIEILEEIHTWSVSNRQDDATLYAVRMKITSLHRQLKDLVNGNQ